MTARTAIWVGLVLCVLAWGVTTLATPWVMRFATWIGGVDRRGYRKAHRGSIPLMGGLAVAAPFLVLCSGLAFVDWLRTALPASLLEVINLPHGVIEMVAAVRHEFAPLAIGSALVLVAGAIDDIYRLRPMAKLVFQLLAALIVVRSGYVITELGLPLLGTVTLAPGVGFVLALVWIVGLTNAFNMTDGVDGLATGIALIASVSFAIMAALQGNLFVLLLSLLLAGSLVAFLRYNFPPGSVFLGDTGSLFLGFTLATVALMGRHKGQATVLLSAPVLILSLPIIEMGLSVARRYARGQPVFAADAGHTHHRLFRRGLSGRKTVLFLYGVCVLLAAAGICFTCSSGHPAGRVLCTALYLSAVLTILWAGGYVQGPRTLLTRLSRRADNRLLDALAVYGSRAISSNQGLAYAPEVLSLLCRHAGLQRVEVILEDGTVLQGKGESFGGGDVTEVHLDADMRHQGPARIHVVFNRKVGELETQDVSAAVTRLFETARVRQPVDVSLKHTSDVLGLGVSMLDYGTVLDVVKRWRETHDRDTKSRYIIALNPHSVMMSRRNALALQSMAGAAMAIPDGVGMIWAANILGYSHQGRCTGPTLMLNLCDWGRQHGFRHFFYGGKPGVADTLVERLSAAYPGLAVAGTYAPPFHELSEAEDRAICAMLNDSHADIIWVGLGAPKQEQWMAAHEDRLTAPVMVGVGAAFDYHSGAVKWAPAWVRNIGMEWAYRLARDPKRLWRRNLDSPLFLLHLVLERLKPPAFRGRTPHDPS